MNRIYLIAFAFVITYAISCTTQEKNKTANDKNISMNKVNENLPTIGILIFEGVIMNEVIAPLDVFSKNEKNSDNQLFNVILIAKEHKTYVSAQGLQILPDYTLADVPNLKVLVVPSSYTPEKQTADKELIEFIKQQNQVTDYISSHCAGAFLIGEAGIAADKNIVTYVTGGELLKEQYPNLKVADDTKVATMKDGKFLSSNGNLVSYTSSLELLEILTNKTQRLYVEESILLNELKAAK
ncbi:DJ-1/PfpI family protein [Kordia sp.]|uniref:DJ-1/PfpI family protein n=1 Tax=Kordia sp. TaxID=1965332 RepID=UPI003B5CBC7B